MKKLRFIFIFLAMTSSFLARSQEMVAFLQGGDIPWTAFEFENLWAPKQEIEKDAGKTDVIYRQFLFSQQLVKAEKLSFGITTRYQKLDFNKDQGLLRDYYNIQFGGNFTYSLADNRFWTLSYSYGSASDKPFNKSRDAVDTVNFVHKLNERWFFVANYSNNRSFLNGVPLPGVFYVKEMTREKILILGFPFIMWKTPVGQKFSFTFVGLMPWNYRARFHYQVAPFFRPYIGVEQVPHIYFRSDREKRYDRVFWFERRLGLGVEGGITRQIRFDLSGGFSFDRQLYEARNLNNKKKSLNNIENGVYTAVTLKASF